MRSPYIVSLVRVFNGWFASLGWAPGVYTFRTDNSKPFGHAGLEWYVRSNGTLLLGLAAGPNLKSITRQAEHK